MRYTKAKTEAISKLEFDPERHRYASKGILVPGVTTVIDDMNPVYQAMPSGALHEARERGTKIHLLTQQVDEGMDPQDTPEEFFPYIMAWEAFKHNTGFEIIEIEGRVYHTKYRYAGTFDRLGWLNDQLVVVDIKSGLLYPEYALQTAAYQAAINEGRLDEPVTGRWAVQLRPDGKYHMTEFTDKADLGVFVSQLNVYNWRIRHGR